MRLFLVILLCLGLATCASPIPHARIITPADDALQGRHSFQLVDPQSSLADTPPFPERYAQLPQLLRQGLSARGYHESQPPQTRVYYWLAVQDKPLTFKVDAAGSLGPYQAIHRLRDETGTLRLRITDLNDVTLWEGLISTGLSPARDSAELLERAVHVLTEQLPKATP
ncbi:hypothetical protein OU800_02930 [Pseudomonas sp. GOM7]|uniref:hypothetical protein n=1 Tax=unclassified Pseudomonas TaxID=196821 RepID=UPI00227C59B2|nr:MULTISPECIES: hypothetical protein [unclassified Pseudomonas]WAJ38209.1 hypothetical protein OU800_02930 [Pseudomonas sp. GOM7]